MWRPLLVFTVLLALIELVIVANGAPWWILPVGIAFMLIVIFDRGRGRGDGGGDDGGDGGGDGGG